MFSFYFVVCMSVCSFGCFDRSFVILSLVQSRTFSCRPSKSATTSPPPTATLPQANAGPGTIGGGVYMGNEDWHKRSAPYHVWSAPKTKKPIRSCPGGGFATNSSQTMMSMNEPVSRYNTNCLNQVYRDLQRNKCGSSRISQ